MCLCVCVCSVATCVCVIVCSLQSLNPSNGLLSGDRVRPFMISSKLPMDVLGKVWSLSDIDKDGSLDKDEFSVVSIQ